MLSGGFKLVVFKIQTKLKDCTKFHLAVIIKSSWEVEVEMTSPPPSKHPKGHYLEQLESTV